MDEPAPPIVSFEDAGALLAGLRAGDAASSEEVVRRYSPRLLATIRRILRNEEDARDALQDAFLSAFRSLDTFEGQAQLGTWLHRIAVNAALMKLRSQRRRPEVPINTLLPRFHGDAHPAEPAAPWPNPPERAFERKET